MSKFVGGSNAFRRPRKGDRLKADDVGVIQRAVADMQSVPGSMLGQQIEMVRLEADLATEDSADALLQGYSVADEEFSDIGTHAKRSVFNPYPDTVPAGLVPVVRVGGAVVPVRGGGGGGSGGLAKTPSGGIPARSGTTIGTATCNLAEIYLDAGTPKIREKSPTETATIHNMTQVVISGSSWIQWKTDGTNKIIDVDDCPGATGGGISISGGTA